MSGRAEPFRRHDDRQPPHGLVAVVRHQLVQQRPHVVDDAGMVARELLEREQRRAAHRRAVVLEPAPQQLDLRAEAELPDRAIGDRALAEVRAARRGLELVVPLRAQLRELALLALAGERVGRRRSVRQRRSQRRRASGAGPDVPRRRPDQPAGALLLEHVRRPAGDPRAAEHRRRQIGGGISATSSTTAAQYSTFVSSWRSGDFSRSTFERGLLERRRHLDARRAELDRGALEHAGARVVGAVDAVAEAHDPLAAIEHLTRRTPRRRRARRRRRSSAARAPARRRAAGPESVPTADESTAAQSAPVEAAIRAVKVEAFSPCSAAEIQYVSTAFDVPRVGLAAPADQELRGRVLALRDLGLRHRPAAVAARRLRDDRERRRREPRQIVARLRAARCRRACRAPTSRRASPAPACRSAGTEPLGSCSSIGSDGGIGELMSSSTSSPQTFSNGYRPTSSSMSMPR